MGSIWDPFGMLFGVPGNFENGARTLTGATLDLLFSGPISRPEFAADFFKTFCTFKHFGALFGSLLGPFGSKMEARNA